MVNFQRFEVDFLLGRCRSDFQNRVLAKKHILRESLIKHTVEKSKFDVYDHSGDENIEISDKEKRKKKKTTRTRNTYSENRLCFPTFEKNNANEKTPYLVVSNVFFAAAERTKTRTPVARPGFFSRVLE